MKRLLREKNLMRAREAMQQGLKVAIDCSLEKTMSDRVSKVLPHAKLWVCFPCVFTAGGEATSWPAWPSPCPQREVDKAISPPPNRTGMWWQVRTGLQEMVTRI